jgi:chaperonin GroEL
MNPFMLSKALYSVSQDIIDIVKTFSRGVTTKQEIQQVATISAQDEEVGQLIADVMEATGHDCTITVEEGKTTGITHEIKTGMQFDQ